ncbi:MAG TPA: gamma-glutamyltransferase [Jatrophihabitans sp.]
MRTRPLALTVLALATGALLAVTTVSLPAGAGAARERTAGKQPLAVGTGGAVTSADLDASRAGIDVLRHGGNAIDAAVATAGALGVTEPFVAGPGGGGFMVIYLAHQHRVVTIDGREKCPAKCTSTMFQDSSGRPMDFEHARRSGMAVGVPGMVATWADAVRQYGRHSFGADLQPAIGIAKRGFRVDRNFHQQEEASLADLQSFTSSRQLFLTPDGQPLPIGSVLHNPDLARTYQLLAERGPDFLYRGKLATDIARTVQHPPVSGQSEFPIEPGVMTRQDLADYTAPNRNPTHVRYRGLDVYGMAPPSSGGITVGEALNILSRWKLGSQPRARAMFEYLEASRLAFADRNAYIGDSDYVNVPQHGLLDPKYAATRSCLIGDHALSSPAPAGHPYQPYGGCGASSAAGVTDHEGRHTNHLVVVDRWGNVVSYTNTIEQIAGTGMTVPGRGFLLNNEMTDFDFAPPAQGAYDPNLPAGGKRPRSSMSPTIVLKNGAFDFAVGSPGGSTIITTVLQILLNHIDFRMSLPDALWAPRVSQRNASQSQAEQAFYDSALAKRLTDRYGEGFSLVTGAQQPLLSYIGDATGVQSLGGGRLQAVAEKVREGGGSALVVNP